MEIIAGVRSMAPAVADDLFQFLMTSDDMRSVCCTPPRHRRQRSANITHIDRLVAIKLPLTCLHRPIIKKEGKIMGKYMLNY